MEQPLKPDQNTDCELTSLNWLTDLDHQAMKILHQFTNGHEVTVKAEAATAKCKEQDALRARTKKPKKVKPLQSRLRNLAPKDRYESFLNKVREDIEILRKSEHLYRADSSLKPPFYFYRMIGMAMMDTGRQLTLKQICAWIKLKFAYFRNGTKWNNSIRHNLSLHPYFCNMGRNKEQKDKDKGGFWKLGIDPKKLYKKRIRNRKSSNNANKSKKKLTQKEFTSERKEATLAHDKERTTNVNAITSNTKNVLQTSNSHQDHMEDKIATFGYITMENNEEELHQDQQLDIILTNVELADNMEKSQQDVEMSNEMNTMFGFREDRNRSPVANVSIDLSIMDHVNHLLTTCDHLQPYLSHCPLSQTTQLLRQLERMESDLSSSDTSVSSSIVAQQQVPLYPATDTMNSVVVHLRSDSSSEEESAGLISTPASCLWSSRSITKRTSCPLQDKDDDLQPQTECAASEVMITLQDNTDNGSNMNASMASPIATSSSSTSPSTMSLVYPTITATVRDIDYPNSYKPYVDNIDEEFYYLQNIDNRNDDILENLFGISSSDY